MLFNGNLRLENLRGDVRTYGYTDGWTDRRMSGNSPLCPTGHRSFGAAAQKASKTLIFPLFDSCSPTDGLTMSRIDVNINCQDDLALDLAFGLLDLTLDLAFRSLDKGRINLDFVSDSAGSTFHRQLTFSIIELRGSMACQNQRIKGQSKICVVRDTLYNT